MSLPNNNSHVMIDLNKILNLNDFIETKRMEKEFELNGWCFVLLPAELIPNSGLINAISNFFASNQKSSRHSQRSKIYGYSNVDHKEGIKLLTGRYFSKFAHTGLVPRNLVYPLNDLCQVLDAAAKRLIEVLDQNSLFQQKPSLSTLMECADLSLQDEHFGMLDIVNYFNDKSGVQTTSNGQTTEEVNCVSHYDPGLLSISILSTHEGLQLKDMPNKKWIDGPLQENIGVIWLGEAASRITQNRLKAGIHRVIYPREGKCRLTIWYELCTMAQLETLSGGKLEEVMDAGEVTFENLPDISPITVLSGEKKLAFLKRVEWSYGLSASKSGPPIYKLQKHSISYPTTNQRADEETMH